MTCRPFGARPLPELVLIYRQWNELHRDSDNVQNISFKEMHMICPGDGIDASGNHNPRAFFANKNWLHFDYIQINYMKWLHTHSYCN